MNCPKTRDVISKYEDSLSDEIGGAEFEQKQCDEALAELDAVQAENKRYAGTIQRLNDLQTSMSQCITERDKRIEEMEDSLNKLGELIQTKDWAFEKLTKNISHKDKRIEVLAEELEQVVNEVLVDGGISESTPNAAGQLVSTEPKPSQMVAEKVSQMKKKIKEIEAEKERLNIIKNYADHKSGCLYWKSKPCDCGLEQSLKGDK